jgi:hypothetical protein
MEIPHFAGIAAVEPLAQELELGKGLRRRNPAEIEPDGPCLAFDLDR